MSMHYPIRTSVQGPRHVRVRLTIRPRQGPDKQFATGQYASVNAFTVAHEKVLELVVARDTLLVSDASRCYRLVAGALDILHESIEAAGERVCGTIKGFLRGSRSVSAKSLARGGDDQAMATNHELSLNFNSKEA